MFSWRFAEKRDIHQKYHASVGKSCLRKVTNFSVRREWRPLCPLTCLISVAKQPDDISFQSTLSLTTTVVTHSIFIAKGVTKSGCPCLFLRQLCRIQN